MLIRIVIQIGVLYLFYYAGVWIQKTFHLLMPGSIIGMLLLFALLMTKKFKEGWIEQGASFLLSHLPLLFIPVTVGIIDFLDLFKGEGFFSIIVVIISSIIVMVASSAVSQWIVVRKNSYLQIQSRESREV
ncbi:CidA/LrgA family protein [Calidifontibacillus erzurumensis]|uniref:CidA/LrgA family protein n=1 Tax=Calidifontibacillus erzurumensis TaxID=2741433 RepID=A0A8J8KBS4_9BACI|nr:CidA/LrgA family protein [Calidifontibacillus erzurumensis]NSL51338.1 CidA/LrgA family protein [Calidifontibacillus erzurumensis]